MTCIATAPVSRRRTTAPPRHRAAAASSSGVASRPILFTKDDNSVTVACTYDYMGRRATKVVTENGQITTSHRFLYRGYLQVACCDRTRANHPCLWLITWDPTQDVATRPLAIQKDGTWYTYGWDLTKNIWEAYTTTGYIGTAYTYTAYGQVTANGSITQPIQWSSEYNEDELGVVYYNYRHYNPVDGRWAGRDMWSSTKDDYKVVDNEIIFTCDALGLLTIGIDGTNYDTKHHPEQRSNVTRFLDAVNDQTLYYGGPGSRDTSTGFSDILGTSYSSEEVGFGQIRDMVYTDICSIYRNDPNIEINLVGWSRGAVIAVEIAELLNEKGCCNGTRRRLIRSMNPFEGWKWECVCTYKRGIKVNFIGLFDPVDMSFFNSNTSIKPDNVTSLFSIQSDSRSVKEQVFFQPQEYEGEERKKVKRNNDGSRTKHADIGGTEDSRENNALALMKEKAGQAGVKFK